MILDALLQFTGAPSGGISNLDGRNDKPTTGAQGSSNILDLMMGQTNVAGVNIPATAGGGLPLSQSTPFAGPGRDLGIGDDPALKLLVQVTTAFNNLTNFSAAIQLAPDSGTGTPGSFVTAAVGPTVLTASMVAGARILDIDWPRPAPGQVPPRFAQLLFTGSGGSANTTGLVQGFAVLDRFDQPLDANAVLGGYIPGIVIAN